MDDAPAKLSGFDSEALAQAPKIMQSAIDAGDLAGGLTLVWRKGEIAQLETLGKRDLSAGKPMTRDTLFRIASMSKPVTSAAAMMLMEQGRLALEDPITKWAPEFSDMRVLVDAEGSLENTVPAKRAITIEDLMTHRSGLSYGFTSVGPVAYAYDAALGDVLRVGTATDDWMKALASLPLLYQPGERFQYSHSTDVLGFIVGRIVGKPFREALMEMVLQPLGMKDTDFYVPPAKRDRAAVVYKNEAGGLEPLNFLVHDEPPAFCGGGGGLISTVDDYLTFARMLLGEGEVDGVRLLKPETVRLMRQNRFSDEQRKATLLGIPIWLSQGFGLGLSTIMDEQAHQWMGAGRVGAFGWPGAFGTWWQADPAEEMILIFLIQDSMPLGPEAVTSMGEGRRMGARMVLPFWQKAIYGALGG